MMGFVIVKGPSSFFSAPSEHQLLFGSRLKRPARY